MTSINPVSETEAAAVTGNGANASAPQRARAVVSTGSPVSPDKGSAPNPEVRTPQNTAVSAELPQDEVQVQRDGASGKVVIRYLDPHGNLIVQIPSSEVLRLAQAVDRALGQVLKRTR